MFRKSTGKSSVKKYSAVPAKPKAPEATEPVAKEVKPAEPAAAPAPAEIGKVLDNHDAVSKLVSALRDPDADIARDAATALGTLANTAAVQPLIEVLINVGGYFHGVVRAAAASSLAELRDPRAVESLIHASRDPLAEPSAEAIRALAAIGDARAISPLIEVVRNSNGFFLPVARRAAVVALAGFKNEQATAELRAVSQNTSEDVAIREAANEAIKKTVDKKAAR